LSAQVMPLERKLSLPFEPIDRSGSFGRLAVRDSACRKLSQTQPQFEPMGTITDSVFGDAQVGLDLDLGSSGFSDIFLESLANA